ncbi:MAG: hypothetical protein JKY37_34570 [Nannocystaceae bacterium]|nr:hypothetical protein [Nannocystaceae bacterium]
MNCARTVALNRVARFALMAVASLASACEASDSGQPSCSDCTTTGRPSASDSQDLSTSSAPKGGEGTDTGASDVGTSADTTGLSDTTGSGDTGQPPTIWEDDYPLGNVFYGAPYSGSYTANARIHRYQNARRFMATRSGLVQAMRYNNRTLTRANIDDRCDAQPGSVWCVCVDNALGPVECGYTLSNSYHVGNGGTQVVSLQEDDGSADHHPSGVVLAESSPFVPLELWQDQYPIIAFVAPYEVVAGEIYHLVWTNLSPPEHAVSGLSVEAAASVSPGEGAIGLNGYGVGSPEILTGGPLFGASDAVFGRDNAAEPWLADPDTLPWYEIQYADSVWTGNSTAFYLAQGDGAAGGRRDFGGDAQVRQVFVVQDGDRNVDGLWICLARTSGDDPLQLELADGRGTSLASASIVAAEFESSKTWVYAALSGAVDLLEGETYTLTLSTLPETAYQSETGFALNYGPYQSTNRDEWTMAWAEYSGDGGTSWAAYVAYHEDRDLSLLFTITGKPKSIGL